MKQLTLPHTIVLTQDPDRTTRLHGSRVTLDTLIAAFKGGDTPVEIHEGFPSLRLSQINDAIAWYLSNQVDADNYLNERAAQSEAFRQLVKSRPDHVAFREMMRQPRK